MWYCSECGQKNEGRYCQNCGAEFMDPMADSAKSMYDIHPRPNPPEKSNKGLIIGIIAAAAVIVIGASVVIGVMIGNNGLQKNDAISNTPEMGEIARADDSNEDNLMDAEEKPSLGEYYVTETNSYLSLREAPAGDSTALARLNNGNRVSLLERTDTRYWYVYDHSSGQYGYILCKYLTDDISKVRDAYEPDVVKPSSKTILSDYYVSGTKNYLAIRSVPSSSASSEIGKTYNGYTVGVIEKTNKTFWYVYDYNSGLYGYVKCGYLSGSRPSSSVDVAPTPSDDTVTLCDDEYIVSGVQNYLGIRNEPSSSDDAEIGRSYNGNTVKVLEKTNDTYWYIYDYSTDLYGYVKCQYLTK